MKLWDKGYQLDKVVEAFMTGDDPHLDQKLITYDCMGSIAHAKMLHKIGVLTAIEFDQLQSALNTLIQEAQKGTFVVQMEDEDVHTAVENALVKQLGDVGKKLHTARSRNDQVLLDMRLYTKTFLHKLSEALLGVVATLLDFAHNNQAIPMPGRTHFQRAMPSSVGLWAGAFAEALLDDMELVKSAYDLTDQCPLGSAASYGASLPLDRAYVAQLLGFKAVQNNVLYVNNSRGKFEAILLHALTQIASDLAKVATDIIIFAAPEFGYFKLPKAFCPGSSLMPQKVNPCPLELIRAKGAMVQGYLMQTLSVIRALPSGYNRDFQETKRPFMEGLETTWSMLVVFDKVFAGMEVQKQRCLEAFTPELFATDAVLDLVKKGTPFRDAYRHIGQHLQQVAHQDPIENILSKTHLGATGQLGLEGAQDRLQACTNWVNGYKKRWVEIQENLLAPMRSGVT